MATQDGRALARIDQTAGWTADHDPVPEPFYVIERTADGRRTIAPCGELDLATAPRLEERLAGAIDTVLDLSELSFIDSSGIRVLISTARRARAEAWELTVQNPQPAVLRAIEIVGLDQHLGLERHKLESVAPK